MFPTLDSIGDDSSSLVQELLNEVQPSPIFRIGFHGPSAEVLYWFPCPLAASHQRGGLILVRTAVIVVAHFSDSFENFFARNNPIVAHVPLLIHLNKGVEFRGTRRHFVLKPLIAL